jgi:hypothetical protein
MNYQFHDSIEKILIFKTLLLVIFISTIFLSCTIKTHKDKNGIKIVYKVPWIGHGRSVAKLYYKNKELSSNLLYHKEKSYIISPDKKMILFIEHYQNQIRYSLYNIFNNHHYHFHQSEDLIELDLIGKEYEKIEWKDNVIILSNITLDIFLYIQEEIMEKVSKTEPDSKYISYSSLYEYFHILIKQLYDRIEVEDQRKLVKIFTPYLNLFPVRDYHINIPNFKDRDLKLFDKMGESFKIIIEKLKGKYKSMKMFKIFEKNFYEKFEEKNEIVQLKRKNLVW